MPNPPSIVTIADVELQPYGERDGFHSHLRSIGDALGTRGVGLTEVTLEPGERAWPYHLHHANEEVFVILEGRGTLRYDGAEYGIEAGQVVLTPPGPGTAHQIVNTSDARLRYLALSTKISPEICYYPDSDKVGAYPDERGGPDMTLIAPASAQIDYWDGEGE